MQKKFTNKDVNIAIKVHIIVLTMAEKAFLFLPQTIVIDKILWLHGFQVQQSLNHSIFFLDFLQQDLPFAEQ